MSHKNAINEIYKQREDFIIIGLTGRSGSGCSTAAELLSKKFYQLAIVDPCLGNSPNNQDRKKYIIHKFAKCHWQPFFNIQVRSIITSFILECTFEEFSSEIHEQFNHSELPNNIKQDYDKMHSNNNCLNKVINREKLNESERDQVIEYLTRTLPNFTNQLKDIINQKSNRQFIPIYQTIGDNIRKYGTATHNKEENVKHIYAISDRINSIIKALRRTNKSNGVAKDYFVIDALRNPFEALFFQERYSAFYLVAINATEVDRIDRLKKKFNYTQSEITEIDEKECPSGTPIKHDNFISQNISACIQHADIHITNPGDNKNLNHNLLKEQLIKYVSLIQHPGIITPTRDEKLMQIAFTAKLNSGCLSRQVGALVANTDMVVKAIGWNSSPDDQVPCILRDTKSLLSNNDNAAFSKYEKTDVKFREKAQAHYDKFRNEQTINGLNVSYCFKDLYNEIHKKGNQVHNRALHAEENAFLQIAKYGGEGALNGILFTTASPCDSCARKAYQLGISKIVYIDPYPGIAIDHVIKTGDRKIEIALFCGAIGRAYHQLYTPIIQIKDELQALEEATT